MLMNKPLLRGVLILSVVVCLLMISAHGVHPLPLAIMGMAIVCLALMPK